MCAAHAEVLQATDIRGREAPDVRRGDRSEEAARMSCTAAQSTGLSPTASPWRPWPLRAETLVGACSLSREKPAPCGTGKHSCLRVPPCFMCREHVPGNDTFKHLFKVVKTRTRGSTPICPVAWGPPGRPGVPGPPQDICPAPPTMSSTSSHGGGPFPGGGVQGGRRCGTLKPDSSCVGLRGADTARD